MGFNVIALRNAEAADHGGALYPGLSSAGDRFLIEMEKIDGNSVSVVTATGLSVLEVGPDGKLRPVGIKLSDAKIDVYITDARVAVACEKYDTGGGWRGFDVGGLAVAAVANATSHALAARRRKGKMLVGQVRYPWLSTVGARSRSGFGTSNGLRLGLSERVGDGARRLFLDLTLDKHADAPAIAQAVVRRCATYWLRSSTLPADRRAEFGLLAKAGRLTTSSKSYGTHSTPHHLYAKAETAYLALAATPSGSST